MKIQSFLVFPALLVPVLLAIACGSSEPAPLAPGEALASPPDSFIKAPRKSGSTSTQAPTPPAATPAPTPPPAPVDAGAAPKDAGAAARDAGKAVADKPAMPRDAGAAKK